jgi:hypothetical protein
MDTTKKTKKSWSIQDTNTVIWHSKGIKAKDACAVLVKILLDRTEEAILGKVYEVQRIEKENALKAYRASERKKPTEDNLDKEFNVAEVAIKERIESFQENNAIQDVVEEKLSDNQKETLIYTEEDIMVVENGLVFISGGGIRVPFAGVVTSDFEIEGTFTIRKLGKPVLI